LREVRGAAGEQQGRFAGRPDSPEGVDGMSCPICGADKPSWCDCTENEKEQYCRAEGLEEENFQINSIAEWLHAAGGNQIVICSKDGKCIEVSLESDDVPVVASVDGASITEALLRLSGSVPAP
jgi:hypothetical protein